MPSSAADSSKTYFDSSSKIFRGLERCSCARHVSRFEDICWGHRVYQCYDSVIVSTPLLKP